MIRRRFNIKDVLDGRKAFTSDGRKVELIILNPEGALGDKVIAHVEDGSIIFCGEDGRVIPYTNTDNDLFVEGNRLFNKELCGNCQLKNIE